MTIEDIKRNPELFLKHYKQSITKLAAAYKSLEKKKNVIYRVRKQNKALKSKYKVLNEVSQAKKHRGKQLAIQNRMEDLFYLIQVYYPKTTLVAVLGASRKREVVEPRHLMAFFMRDKYKFSWQTIGKLLGGRDHSSAISSYKRVEDLCFSDKEFCRRVDVLRSQIKNI